MQQTQVVSNLIPLFNVKLGDESENLGKTKNSAYSFPDKLTWSRLEGKLPFAHMYRRYSFHDNVAGFYFIQLLDLLFNASYPFFRG